MSVSQDLSQWAEQELKELDTFPEDRKTTPRAAARSHAPLFEEVSLEDPKLAAEEVPPFAGSHVCVLSGQTLRESQSQMPRFREFRVRLSKLISLPHDSSMAKMPAAVWQLAPVHVLDKRAAAPLC